MAKNIQISVNGRMHSVEASPDTPLLYVLRNELQLNGPQYGCGLEQCGSCLVLVNGKAVPSCMVPVANLNHASIITLEGLGTRDNPHPAQQAFIEEQAAQCSFCINGMIIAATALLSENPQPSDEQIRAALNRNLCRCGSHQRIIAAVKRATAHTASGEAMVAASGQNTGRQLAYSANPAKATEGASTAEQKRQISPDQIDAWLEFLADGSVRVFCGKVELGTGVATALSQMVADELDLPLEQIAMVMGATSQTPDQGYTAGSKTLQSGSIPLRQACAEARAALFAMAADRLEATVDDLVVTDGVIGVRGAPIGSPSVSYTELIGGKRFNLPITGNAKLKQPEEYRITGKSIPRLDLPGKMTGVASFIQDLRIPYMLHGRVIRPGGVCAKLESIDESSIQHLPGIVKVVRNGNFAGVVAEREEQAIRAARLLRINWKIEECLPPVDELYTYLRSLPTTDTVVAEKGNVDAALPAAAKQLQATYYQPYHNHASIGPSCAVADVRGGQATVWCSTQGVYQLRGALAQLLGMETEQLEVIHIEGAGCYGHNGFDDVAADAALLSQAVGRPVRVQWSRHDENVWEPKGPAMIMNVQGGLDAGGNVVAWDYGVCTPTHSSRPGGQAGNLLAGQLVSPPFTATRNWRGGGDRNAQHTYTFPHNRVVAHWLASSPIRQSSFRSLGGYANTFANESFIDELAAAAGIDAVEFRLRHLDDPRSIEVIRRAAEHADWQSRPSPQAASNERIVSGRGIAYAQYETKDAYIATIAEVGVDRESGFVRVKRVIVAHDCGLVVNPDGLANQIEGNIIQAMSRALKEQVTFDRTRVTSVDWLSYPILTFTEIPAVEVVIINRPDQPPLGAGESSTVTAAPAIANAIFDATGQRVRAIPFTPDRVMASLKSKV